MRQEFEISTANALNHIEAAFDIVAILMAGIADAGRVVRHSARGFHADRTHILTDRMTSDLFDFMTANRLRYGLLVTEEIAPDGAFGWSALEHYGDPYGEARAYAPQIERAAFVWCVFEKSMAFCRRHNDRVGRLPFGFSPRLLPRHPVDWERRDIPALVTGELTERRAAVVRECQARGVSLQHSGGYLPAWARDLYLARARLHVAPPRTDAHMRYVNPQRVVQSVCFKVGLVLELEPGISHDFDGFFDPAAPGALAERTIAILADPGALRETVERRFERFADTRAMAKPFAELIAATAES